MINSLEQLLKQYTEIKAALDSTLQVNGHLGINPVVTAQTVINTIHQLYQLMHNGKKIHEMMTKQKTSRHSEYKETCEYVHATSSAPFVEKEKKNEYPFELLILVIGILLFFSLPFHNFIFVLGALIVFVILNCL
jgi:DNA-binding transcriptional regulator WhiA